MHNRDTEDGVTSREISRSQPVVGIFAGHAGIGIGMEALRATLAAAGTNPNAPRLEGDLESLSVLQRYGDSFLRKGSALRSGAAPLVPRALLTDFDSRSTNLILGAYPELFSLREMHVIAFPKRGVGNWAAGRRLFRGEIAGRLDVGSRIKAISPEKPGGFVIIFSMGGSSGSSISSETMAYLKGSYEQSTLATVGVIPEFGRDEILEGRALVGLIMNLAAQIRHSDVPILLENSELRFHAARLRNLLSSRSSAQDLLPSNDRLGWLDHRNQNLLAGQAVALFIESFARHTDWSISYYGAWLASRKPRFLIPWTIPMVYTRESASSMNEWLSSDNEGALFNLETDARASAARTDSACVVVKMRDEIDAAGQSFFRGLLKEKFGVSENRVLFVRVPALKEEPESACILLNLRAVRDKFLQHVASAKKAWEQYDDEFERNGLSRNEFIAATREVESHCDETPGRLPVGSV